MKKRVLTTLIFAFTLIATSIFMPLSQANAMAIDTKIVDEYLFQTDEEVLGWYYTALGNSSEARIKNIKKAAKRINKEVIEPNETFSYNEVVGNSNIAEDGWKKAGVFINGKLVEDYGGGICQVSSTLFNAVDQVGLTVTERHSHSSSVKYVPAGRDATVAYGSLDFKFTNPYNFPVKIKAKVLDNQYVAVKLTKADA